MVTLRHCVQQQVPEEVKCLCDQALQDQQGDCYVGQDLHLHEQEGWHAQHKHSG